LGRPLGWVDMLLHRRRRRSVRSSIAQVFGSTKSSREIAKMTRQVFEYHQMRSLLLVVAPLLSVRGKLQTYFPLRNLEHLDRALEAGTGAMLLTSHINSVGAFLVIAQLRQLGYRVRTPVPDSRDVWAPTPFRRFIHLVCGAPTMTQAIDAFYA